MLIVPDTSTTFPLRQEFGEIEFKVVRIKVVLVDSLTKGLLVGLDMINWGLKCIT